MQALCTAQMKNASLDAFSRYATLLVQGTDMNTASDDRFLAIKTGLLEFAVLRVIHASASYAGDILKALAPTPLRTQEGTLYPLLSKLRRDGFLEYEWRESDAGPPRKYYVLTAKGKAQLEDLQDYWQKITSTITKLGK